MRWGEICRLDFTGLGVQSFEAFKNLRPDKALAIDLSHLNGQQNDYSRYPGAPVLRYTPYPDTRHSHPDAVRAINDFLDGLDLVFTCETPYDYHLFTEARRRGIKTILQYNFELLDHTIEPDLPQPDLFAAPSLWRYNDLQFSNKVFLPVPVDRHRFPFQKRTSATTFLHIVGTRAMEDRNGTDALIAAWGQVRSDSRLVIHSQRPIGHVHDRRIAVHVGCPPDNAVLYHEGDVFVMPRKFGGLALPVSEAMSCGMPIIMTDLAPQNGFLHPAGLIPATFSKSVRMKPMVDVFEPNVHVLAQKIDQLAFSPELVAEMSDHSDAHAESLSWERMAPVYLRLFEMLVDGAGVTEMANVCGGRN